MAHRPPTAHPHARAQLLACATQPTNLTFAYRTDPRFGVYVTAIDGVNATDASYWALSRNKVSSPVGIGELVLAAGDEVEWAYTPVPPTTG